MEEEESSAHGRQKTPLRRTALPDHEEPHLAAAAAAAAAVELEGAAAAATACEHASCQYASATGAQTSRG